MNIKIQKLLILISLILLVVCIILFTNNRDMKTQLSQEKSEVLLSVFRLSGKSDNWKINDGVLVNTTKHVHLRIDSVDYIGDEYYLSENISFTLRFKDKNTDQNEKFSTGSMFKSEELKNFKSGIVGISYPLEMMSYDEHNIVVEIEYDDKNGNPILEEIEITPVWSFEY
ncbi:hypothetical protein [Sporosalibacterium faouarense]|uniref:hypothetical protein n=1 Tax=Sporosalibacterium faouarense TaxID=516123 RepID=UPI00192BBCFA|nr:hypothetical protein [Sporosalibacterium faouarense]